MSVNPDPGSGWNRSRSDAWLRACTMWGIGEARLAPGTWGSLAALLAGYGLSVAFRKAGWGEAEWTVYAALALLASLATLQAGRHAEEVWGKDPSRVVSDEAAGMWLTLLLLPPAGADPEWLRLSVAFILFRFFDIAKPFGIRSLQKIKGGLGILLDDLVAAIAAGGIGAAAYRLLG